MSENATEQINQTPEQLRERVAGEVPEWFQTRVSEVLDRQTERAYGDDGVESNRLRRELGLPTTPTHHSGTVVLSVQPSREDWANSVGRYDYTNYTNDADGFRLLLEKAGEAHRTGCYSNNGITQFDVDGVETKVRVTDSYFIDANGTKVEEGATSDRQESFAGKVVVHFTRWAGRSPEKTTESLVKHLQSCARQYHYPIEITLADSDVEPATDN